MKINNLQIVIEKKKKKKNFFLDFQIIVMNYQFKTLLIYKIVFLCFVS